MKEYIAYIVKIGNGYLTKDFNASFMSESKYKITFKTSDALWFSKDDVFDIAKRYGGQAIGLLPMMIDVEDK